MANYGVYLTTTDGRPFITPDSMPMNLLTKVTASGNGMASATINIDSGAINLPFIISDALAYASYSMSGNTMTLTAHTTDDNGGAVNMEAYVFSVKEPALPKWGVAIWNAQGRCILTNETRVLRDIKTIGTKGGTGSAGTSINQTIAGKWAILPEIAGVMSGVFQQRPISIVQPFFSRYINGSSQISSIMASTPPTGTQGTLTSTLNSVKAINAALYD
ncbi:hypothetical protein [Erwinia sp. 9145]|uniref:hypothetical protein n=1 Tax=Erwinia sp. 9145 TaxID=1500895 RepID=UPI0005511FCE|nr:hypothetical protein [Erwinia sp. 9145]